ncbi:hypothetical protein [Streptomyces sp. NPDC059479]
MAFHRRSRHLLACASNFLLEELAAPAAEKTAEGGLKYYSLRSCDW